MNSWLRWAALVPAVILAWVCVFILGTIAYGYFVHWLCPPEDIISGGCGADVRALEFLIPTFSGLSAVAVVFSAVFVAPVKKLAVAWGALVVGGTFALNFGGDSTEVLAAIASGAIAVASVAAYFRFTSAKEKKH